MNGGEGRCAVGSQHHVVTVGAEETMKEGADALAVVGNQHAAPPGPRCRIYQQHVLRLAAPRPCHATIFPIGSAKTLQ